MIRQRIQFEHQIAPGPTLLRRAEAPRRDPPQGRAGARSLAPSIPVKADRVSCSQELDFLRTRDSSLSKENALKGKSACDVGVWVRSR